MANAKQSSSKAPLVNVVVDLTGSEAGDDATYVDESEKRGNPGGVTAKKQKPTKRKAAPETFNDGEESDPETGKKPPPKRAKPNSTKKDINASTVQTKKPPKAPAKQDKVKPKSKKPKSKAQLQREGTAARKESKELKAEICSKNEEILRLKKTTADLQQENFDLVRSNKPDTMDENLVESKLSELRGKLMEWSEKYSVPGSLPELDASSMDKLSSALLSPQSPMSNDSGIHTVGRGYYGSAILLNTLLAQFICTKIIEQPFFFLNVIRDDLKRRYVMEFFDDIANLSAEDDRVHEWIAQILDMFVSGSNAVNFIEEKTFFDEASAARFIDGPAKLLLVPLSEESTVNERLEVLKGIIGEAGELTIQLRKQRVGIRCLYIDSEELNQEGFQPLSGPMEAHVATCLEEGDNICNGNKIVMVIEPAIIAYSTDSRECVNKTKFWAKSVVWVEGCEEVEAQKQMEAQNQIESDIQKSGTATLSDAQPEQSTTSSLTANDDGNARETCDSIPMCDSMGAASSIELSGDQMEEVPSKMDLDDTTNCDIVTQGTENKGASRSPKASSPYSNFKWILKKGEASATAAATSNPQMPIENLPDFLQKVSSEAPGTTAKPEQTTASETDDFSILGKVKEDIETNTPILDSASEAKE